MKNHRFFGPPTSTLVGDVSQSFIGRASFIFLKPFSSATDYLLFCALASEAERFKKPYGGKFLAKNCLSSEKIPRLAVFLSCF
jgi:hypothetical protein